MDSSIGAAKILPGIRVFSHRKVNSEDTFLSINTFGRTSCAFFNRTAQLNPSFIFRLGLGQSYRGFGPSLTETFHLCNPLKG